MLKAAALSVFSVAREISGFAGGLRGWAAPGALSKDQSQAGLSIAAGGRKRCAGSIQWSEK